MTTGRDFVGGLVIVSLTVLGVLFVASLPDPQRPWWESNPTLIAFVAFGSVRQAWPHRGRGRVGFVVRGLAFFAFWVAYLVGMQVLTSALHPWAVTQTWLLPTIGVAVLVAVVLALIAHVVRQPTTHRRRIAARQVGLVALLVAAMRLLMDLGPFAGLWALVAIGSVIAIYLLGLELRPERVAEGVGREPVG